MKKNRFFLVLLMTFLIPGWAMSQNGENFPPPENPPVITAHRVTGSIKLDGKLDEQDWQAHEPITSFFRMEPRQGGSLKYRTEAMVLFDDRNLYVGAFCRDSVGRKGIRTQDLRRDFSRWDNDVFLVQLDPQNLKQYCVSFQTTPWGNQSDLQNFNDQNTDSDWNALWTVRTHRTDSGYYAEFAIPFKSIRYEQSPSGDNTWGITFARTARRESEFSVFPAIPQSFSPYRMTYAARLEGLELPEPSANVRIEPYLLYQQESLEQGAMNASEGDFKLGGDVKWAINPRSVLDLTFNTDFAQADVDRAVNNLERFNIFFPERRQFFLENSGIWAGANNNVVVPFFSRSIGLQGNFNAEPARIDAGGRYTMRTEDRAIAGLYVHQAESENSPATSFMVGRYLQNYGKENNVGVMVTHRLDEASGELRIEQSNNTTVTVDGLIRPVDEWTVQYMVSGSRDNANDTLGLAGRVFVSKNANDVYLGWITNFVTENYNPDMGFVFQKNVVQHSPGGYYIWRPKQLPWIWRWDPGAFFNYYHDANNLRQFQQANIYLFPVYIFFRDRSFIQYAIFPTWQNINFSFAPLGIAIAQDDYYYTRHRVNFYTDKSAKVSVSGAIGWGTFYNGKRTTIEGGFRLAPVAQAALTLDYEYNDLIGLGEENEDLRTHLVTLGSRFALNPRVQLSAFYQYNSFDEQGRWNVRASWEYQPLSFVYLVFNDTRVTGLENPFEEQQFIGKVTLLKQF